MGHREPVCFTCGEPVSSDPFANRLPDGTPCPACRDRLLDVVPSLLPGLGVDETTLDTPEAEPEETGGDGHTRMRRIGLRSDPEDPDGPIGA